MRLFKNSRGETDILVVIIIIIGAFLLIGGQFLFQKTKPTTQRNPGGNSGSSKDTLPPAWRIEQITNGANCDSESQSSQVGIAFHGTAPGYYRIEIQNNDVFQPVRTEGAIYNTFTPNANNVQANTLLLKNADGFNTKTWKIVLLRGGTLSGNDLTNAIQMAEKEFPAINCQ